MNKLVEENISPQDDVAAKRHWIIVTQVKSNRIVYFTDDPEYQPHMEGDWYYCSSYLGNIPEGMTLRNCWGWRFNGGVFGDARDISRKTTQETLVEANKKVLLKLLQEKINQIRQPFLPSCKEGDVVRSYKLKQARKYLESNNENTDFLLLQYVAVARNISLLEASKLIVKKASETEAVLLESERFREQMTIAILDANSQEKLGDLREWLLDKVYPALTKQFRFKVENTEPISFDVQLSDAQKFHEMARLKTQLRETINTKRAQIDSQYIQNEAIQKHKVHLAEKVLSANVEKLATVNIRPLEVYAEARGIALTQAAQLVVNSRVIADELLLSTEESKDRLLAKIESIQNLNDINAIEEDLKKI